MKDRVENSDTSLNENVSFGWGTKSTACLRFVRAVSELSTRFIKFLSTRRRVQNLVQVMRRGLHVNEKFSFSGDGISDMDPNVLLSNLWLSDLSVDEFNFTYLTDSPFVSWDSLKINFQHAESFPPTEYFYKKLNIYCTLIIDSWYPDGDSRQNGLPVHESVGGATVSL